MSDCLTFPTLTQTTDITTQTVSTSLSFFTTIEGLTTTVVTSTRACSFPSGVTGTCTPLLVTETLTALTTSTIPVTLTVPVTLQEVQTLFATTCSNGATPDPASSSASDNVSVVVLTVVSTPPPGPTGNVQDNNNGNHSSTPSNIGGIIGGVVGGIFGLAAVVVLVWFILRRKRRWDDIFDQDDDRVIAHTGVVGGHGEGDVEPKPYQYGLVGQVAHPPNFTSSTHSQPMKGNLPPGAGDPNNYMMNSGKGSIPPHMMGGVAAVTSRPSTAGSTQPLRPGTASSPSHGHTQSNSTISSPPMSLSNWSAAGAYTNPLPSTMYTPSEDGTATSSGMGGYQNNRAGSPISYQEPSRRLHVTNMGGTAASPESGILSGADGGGFMMGAAGVQLQQPHQNYQVDGKGRIKLSAEPMPIVHTDGGRVQQVPTTSAGAGPSGPSGSTGLPPGAAMPSQAPPAYSYAA